MIRKMSSVSRNLICFCGIPAAGKSTLALSLSEYLNCTVLSIDQLRKSRATTDYTTESVYRQLIREAIHQLKGDPEVILDATFYLRRQRKLVYSKLLNQVRDLRSFLLILHIEVNIAESRIRDRHPDSSSVTSVVKFRNVIDKFEWPSKEEKKRWDQVIPIFWSRNRWQTEHLSVLDNPIALALRQCGIIFNG